MVRAIREEFITTNENRARQKPEKHQQQPDATSPSPSSEENSPPVITLVRHTVSSTNGQPDTNNNKPRPKEILFLCDSNGEHINTTHMFPENKSVKLWSPTTDKAMQHL